MNRWLNRVAVVTGASSGIGAACCKDLVSKGMIVVGLARREHRLQELKSSLPVEQRGNFHGRKCDVSKEQQVIDAFVWIEQTLGGADVLINNTGIVRRTNITDEGTSEALRVILETNLQGVSWCAREALFSLRRRKVNDGHVVLINSLAGQTVPIGDGIQFKMFGPSKHAITKLVKVLRKEFNNKGTKTKITSISPGVVDTEIFDKNSPELFNNQPMLRAEDVADAVTYCIQTPSNVLIHELTIKPVGERF